MEKLQRHESMRGYFAYELHGHMSKNKDIWVVTGDLGYGMFDAIRRDYSNRFVNCGAAEQAGLGLSVGLASEGKIPFFYSITPFALFRPAEIIRNYINREQIPVKIIGSGRSDDYKHDGFSHFAGDDLRFIQMFENINIFYPTAKEDVPVLLEHMIEIPEPAYMNLSR